MTLLVVEKNPIKVFRITAFVVVALVIVTFSSYMASKFLVRMWGGVTLGSVFAKNASQRPAVSSASTVAVESVFSPELTPLIGQPTRIYAVKADTQDTKVLDLRVHEVGVAEDGSMETPSNWNEAGWYKKSAMPGQDGNMVINAHYDDSNGRPAGFWGLKKLVEGDRVYITDEYGKDHTYRVTKVFQVSIDDPNRLDILKNDGKGHTLTMITCGGVWLVNAGTYNKRLVVQAELLQD